MIIIILIIILLFAFIPILLFFILKNLSKQEPKIEENNTYEYTKIKNVYIELPNYEFNHGPCTYSDGGNRYIRYMLNRFKRFLRIRLPKSKDYFIGREAIISKLRSLLENDKSGGAYLITGFRGVGKTSFVNKTIKEVKEHNPSKKYIQIDISLAQEKLKSIDVLKVITKKLLDKEEEYKEKQYWLINIFRKLFNPIYKFLTIFSILLFILFLIFGVKDAKKINDVVDYITKIPQKIYDIGTNIEGFFQNTNETYEISQDLIYLICFASITFFLQRFIPKIYTKTNSPIKRLRILNRKLHSEFESEKTSEMSIKDVAKDTLKEKTKSLVADFREIEDEIIFILKKIGKKRNYIFVFDELDKIEPFNSVDKESISSDKFSIFERTRNRQKVIQEVLNNLKYFLNTAQAKFIFVAGREMYDADLADIADRDFFWGSIFHDVIYVESLLKEVNPDRGYEIPQQIERMVFRFLLGNLDYKNSQITLKEYYKYLEHEIFPIKDKDGEEVKKRKIQRCQKVFFVLEEFIIFLTYRSGGLPMKVIKLMEDYIVIKDKKELAVLQNDNQNLCVVHPSKKNNKNRKFLKFNYFQQFEIGFITYLYRPFLHQNSSYLKSLDDKTLVSISFIMDHIFKYHEFGFSWRALELLPEIVDINKSPTIRQFIADLVHYLSNKHIRVVANGFYNFKFFKTTSNEILFLSKISDLSSAAFNFTLDESLPLKKHYKEKLLATRTMFKDDKSTTSYLNTLFLNSTIGDLHFYDKEYDEAIISYAHTIQENKFKEVDQDDNYQFILIIRNILKYGLALEKMNTYDSVYTLYGSLNKIIVERIFKHKKASESQTTFFVTLTEKIQPKDIIKTQKINDLKTLFEIHFAVFLPFIAQLAVMEKKMPGGISLVNLQRTNELVENIFLHINQEERFIVMAEYYHKISGILFAKNGILNAADGQRMTIEDIMKSFGFENLEKDVVVPLEAWLYNCKALLVVIKKFFNPINEIKDVQLEVLFGRKKNTNPFRIEALILLEFYDAVNIDQNTQKKQSYKFREIGNNEALLNKIGNYLSDFGDILISMSIKRDKIDDNFLKSLFLFEENTKDEKVLNLYKQTYNNRLQKGLAFYYLATRYFSRIGRNKKASFTLTKILYVIKNHFQYNSDKVALSEGLFKLLRKKVFKRIVYMVVRIHDNSLRSIIMKNKRNIMREIFSEQDFKSIDANYNVIFQFPEAREALLIMYELQLLTGKTNFTLINNPISSYNRINSNWIRFFELKYKVNLLSYHYKVHISKLIFNRNLDEINIVHSSNDAILYRLKNIAENSRQVLLYQRCFNNNFDSKNNALLSDLLELLKNIENEILLLEKDKNKQIPPSSIEVVNNIYQVVPKMFLSNQLDKDYDNIERENIIFDALFCLIYAIKNLKLFDRNYITNHFHLAETRFQLAFWSGEFNIYRKAYLAKLNIGSLSNKHPSRIIDHIHKHTQIARDEIGNLLIQEGVLNPQKEFVNEKSFEELKKIDFLAYKLKKIIGHSSLYFVSQRYNYELAYQHYYLCLQMHNQGRGYNKTIKDMYLLEDDFNDHTSHFCAAMDRYRINIGLVRDRIDECKNQIARSKLYDNDNYFRLKKAS